MLGATIKNNKGETTPLVATGPRKAPSIYKLIAIMCTRIHSQGRVNRRLCWAQLVEHVEFLCEIYENLLLRYAERYGNNCLVWNASTAYRRLNIDETST